MQVLKVKSGNKYLSKGKLMQIRQQLMEVQTIIIIHLKLSKHPLNNKLPVDNNNNKFNYNKSKHYKIKFKLLHNNNKLNNKLNQKV